VREFLDILREGQIRQIEVHFGEPDVLVVINPLPEQISHMLSRSKYKTLRGHLDHRLIVWDGSDTTHDHIDDCGEFGKLSGIRLTISSGSIRVLTYGRDQKFPDGPDGEELLSVEEVLTVVKTNAFVRKAFPGFDIF